MVSVYSYIALLIVLLEPRHAKTLSVQLSVFRIVTHYSTRQSPI